MLTSFTASFAPIVGYLEEVGVDQDNEYQSRDYPDDFYEGLTDPAFGSGWPFTKWGNILMPGKGPGGNIHADGVIRGRGSAS